MKTTELSEVQNNYGLPYVAAFLSGFVVVQVPCMCQMKTVVQVIIWQEVKWKLNMSVLSIHIPFTSKLYLSVLHLLTHSF